jgi:hypothetical protein
MARNAGELPCPANARMPCTLGQIGSGILPLAMPGPEPRRLCHVAAGCGRPPAIRTGPFQPRPRSDVQDLSRWAQIRAQGGWKLAIRKQVGCGRLRGNTRSWRMGSHHDMAAGGPGRGAICVHLRPLRINPSIRRRRRGPQIQGDAERLESFGSICLPCKPEPEDNRGRNREPKNLERGFG